MEVSTCRTPRFVFKKNKKLRADFYLAELNELF